MNTVRALTTNVTVFGDRAFKEVLKLNEVIRMGPYQSLSEEETQRFFSLSVHVQREQVT